MSVRAAEFVKVWQGAERSSAVSKALGLSPSVASSRASLYRKRGIPLKKMPRGRGSAPLDIKALTKLAKDSLKEQK